MKSVISASSTPTTTPSPIDAALPVICALVWIVPPPSSSWNGDVRVGVPLAPGLPGLDAQQRAMRAGVLLGDLDGAGELHRHRPHLHHDLGLDRVRAVVSSTRPPSTHGTTRSRSVIAAKLSSIDFDVEKRVIQFNGHSVRLLVAGPRYMLGACRFQAGRYRLGPDNATPLGAHGAGGSRGEGRARPAHPRHRWEATLVVGDDPADTSIELTADATSLRVIEGTGGMQALGDDDVASIHQTIDDEVLKRQDIAFRSTAVRGRRRHAPRRGRPDARRRDPADRVRPRRSATTATLSAAPSSPRPPGA